MIAEGNHCGSHFAAKSRAAVRLTANTSGNLSNVLGRHSVQEGKLLKRIVKRGFQDDSFNCIGYGRHPSSGRRPQHQPGIPSGDSIPVKAGDFLCRRQRPAVSQHCGAVPQRSASYVFHHRRRRGFAQLHPGAESLCPGGNHAGGNGAGCLDSAGVRCHALRAEALLCPTKGFPALPLAGGWVPLSGGTEPHPGLPAGGTNCETFHLSPHRHRSHCQ